jgi:hypothetical protein
MFEGNALVPQAVIVMATSAVTKAILEAAKGPGVSTARLWQMVVSRQ